jgi:hypothetical protein
MAAHDTEAMAKVADRLDALAETAELMGDDAQATRLHQRACGLRLQAMNALDDDAPDHTG